MTRAEFWDKVDREDPNGCWEWPGYKTVNRYCFVVFESERMSAHKVAWMLTHGDVPKASKHTYKRISHTCGNRRCVNPTHLFIGSHLNSNKLTETEVIEIHLMHRTNRHSQKYIAEYYDISPSAINSILHRRTWKHVEVPT